MAPKAKATTKKSTVASKRAATSWKTHVSATCKARIDSILQENPELMVEVEKFAESAQQWKKEDEVEQDQVKRFCRGRTTIAKLPPSFVSALLASFLPQVPGEVWMKLQRKAKEFVPRILEFTLGVEPSAWIATEMDRRCEVFKRMAVQRYSFYGERLPCIIDEINMAMSECDSKTFKRSDEWPFDLFGCYQHIIQEGEDNDKEKFKPVIGIKHIIGKEVWASL